MKKRISLLLILALLLTGLCGCSGKGDLIFRVDVEIPRKLTEKQKEILRKFDETASGREYEKKKNFFDRMKDAFN